MKSCQSGKERREKKGHPWLRGIPVGVPGTVIGRFTLPGTCYGVEAHVTPRQWDGVPSFLANRIPAIVPHYFQSTDARFKIHPGSKIKIYKAFCRVIES